jgi:hypothetical protein
MRRVASALVQESEAGAAITEMAIMTTAAMIFFMVLFPLSLLIS